MRCCLTALYCAVMATAAAAAPLDRQLAAAQEAANRYATFETAKRDGWRAFGADVPLMGQHFQHPDGPDYVTGDRIDFSRPSNLVYAEVGGRRRLVALAYIVRKRPDEPLPRGFAGDSDIWHIHDGRRFLAALKETRPMIGRLAGRWFQNRVTHRDGRVQLAMVHLWLLDNPKGRFASHNPRLPYLDLGLPDAGARDMGVARGLALAQGDGCDRMLDAELALSGARRGTIRRIKRDCETLARHVGASLDGPLQRIDAVASSAWQELSFALQTRLTADERRRSRAFVEDGPGICK